MSGIVLHHFRYSHTVCRWQATGAGARSGDGSEEVCGGSISPSKCTDAFGIATRPSVNVDSVVPTHSLAMTSLVPGQASQRVEAMRLEKEGLESAVIERANGLREAKEREKQREEEERAMREVVRCAPPLSAGARGRRCSVLTSRVVFAFAFAFLLVWIFIFVPVCALSGGRKLRKESLI